MVIVTTHAKERMTERMGVSPRKMEKLASKVWKKGAAVPAGYVKQKRTGGHKSAIYRELMGYKFVFEIDEGKVKLITILDKKTRCSRLMRTVR